MVRVKEGTLKAGQKLRFLHTGTEHQVEEVGINRLGRIKSTELPAGSVGYLIAGVKTIRDIEVGDTVTDVERPTNAPIPATSPPSRWSSRRSTRWGPTTTRR